MKRGLVALVGATLVLSGAPADASPDSITLLGPAWDHTALAVKIKAGGVDPAIVSAVEDAVADWNAAIDSLGDHLDDFGLTSVTSGPSDIDITLRKGSAVGSGAVGQTNFGARADGSFRKVNILVSGAALGFAFNATQVGNIARHELGHGLGLGHADFSDDTFAGGWEGDLMQTTLPDDGDEVEIPISACDADAFAAVHAWYEPPTTTTFGPPSASSVSC